jgi:hypothetical protein
VKNVRWWEVCYRWDRGEVHRGRLRENLTEKEDFEDPDINGKIILREIISK